MRQFRTAIITLPLLAAVAHARTQGSAVCAGCHSDVWQSYRHSGMARSFARATAANVPAANSVYYHKASDTYFAVINRDGRYYEQQYQIGFDGRPAKPFEKQIDYVMGSGKHARSYLHRTERNTLIELPLSWYAEKGGYWAMSPGYDRPDHQGFGRTVAYDCMFCHNAYPEIPRGREAPRARPEYTALPEGIDCGRCHGDGDRHVALARGGAPAAQIRGSILNPARLPAERQMEVCMQCHLETTSSPLPAYIVRYERGPFSYRPGEPLGDFVLHFDRARSTDDRFEIDGSAYRLRQSRCFREGRLTCTTCHNPHDAAARDYNAVCRHCHAAALRKLGGDARHASNGNCTGCHMPKRRTADVVHVIMTDHYIQRQPPARDPDAAIPERPQTYRGDVVLYDPPAPARPDDELYLAIAQVSQSSNLDGSIERLTAALEKYRPEPAEYYLQFADALSNAGMYGKALPVYEQALRREPDSVAALERLAVCETVLKQYAEAERTLKRALQLAPDAPAWTQLGMVEQAQGRSADAIVAFSKAIELDPDAVEAHNSMGLISFDRGDSARAESSLREAIRIAPNYAPARNNLANLLASAGRFQEARYEYEAALRYRENYNGARYNYALTLARMRLVDAAEQQLRQILKTDPGDAEAAELLRVLRTREPAGR